MATHPTNPVTTVDERRTVLIVDDAPENLQVLGSMLQREYRVRAATSGPRALQVASSQPRPDLILLDIMMPEMDGFAVLELLQADDDLRDIPVIIVTAMNGAGDEERGLAMGAVDYIAKPVQPGVVLARVRTQLELKRARDVLRDQNAFLEEEVGRRVSEAMLAQDVSIRALARLAEVRDQGTGNHLVRTQNFVRTLARRLRNHPRFSQLLTSSYVEMAAKCAPLHDIGKVGIPDAILRKTDRLTLEEWEVMRTHARLGSDAIEAAERDAEQPVAFLVIAKEIARSHHEKWDGTGYPDGLAGDAIPVSARLMAVADVFDALTSRRPWRRSHSVEEATAIMLAGRGTHFDPDVLDAFVAERARFVAIAAKYADGEPLRIAAARAGA